MIPVRHLNSKHRPLTDEFKVMANNAIFSNINTVCEYGVAGYHLDLYVKGRYLELNYQNYWVEKDDLAMRVS